MLLIVVQLEVCTLKMSSSYNLNLILNFTEYRLLKIIQCIHIDCFEIIVYTQSPVDYCSKNICKLLFIIVIIQGHYYELISTVKFSIFYK